MTTDHDHQSIQLELSVAHDDGRLPTEMARSHLESCDECMAFAAGLVHLDRALARGSFERAPDMTSNVMTAVTRPRTQWWAVAAIALVGVLAGALVGGLGSRLDVSQARDLHEQLYLTGSEISGLSADLVVVERGLHPEVMERVYSGSIRYTAPEQLGIVLHDTTRYPTRAWIPNDIEYQASDGDTVSRAGSRCPIAALPACLLTPTTSALTDQPPFDDGVIVPLEIIGPGRSLAQSSAIEVLAAPQLNGLDTIQVRTTVAAVELIGAITDRGSWRELHPTDVVLMWLDEATLVPVRLEVFPTDSQERELWQLRRGYRDRVTGEPIFIVELTNVSYGPAAVDVDVSPDAPSRGFVDASVDVPTPAIGEGYEIHRSGFWQLGEGGRVEVMSWSDGRNWLMIEATGDWTEPRLFGLSSPFAQPIDIGEGSVGYLSPTGDAVAIHTDDLELVVSGTLPHELLIEVAASIDVSGLPVPGDWIQASNVEVAALPEGTLIPDVDGWAMVGRVDVDGTEILLQGGGARTVLITQKTGSGLDAPIGPDLVAVELRGVIGRHQASTGTLEWVEDGQVIQMTSKTVGMDVLLDLAAAMSGN